jgi:hypothetical protein
VTFISDLGIRVQKKLDRDQHKNGYKSPTLTCTAHKKIPKTFCEFPKVVNKYEEQPMQTNYFAVTI